MKRVLVIFAAAGVTWIAWTVAVRLADAISAALEL